MNIALDYDQTFTRDPLLWLEFVHSANKKGHKVYCVTMRNDNELDEVKQYLGDYVEGIINTSREFKYDFVRSISLKIDIWIDDNPYFITGVQPIKGDLK